MLIVFSTFLLSLLLCRIYLQVAKTRQILAVPNARGSHTVATPSGAGLALVTAFILGVILAAWCYATWNVSLLALCFAALALSVLGFLDDLVALSIRLRLTIYSLVCVLVSTVLLQPVISFEDLPGIVLLLFSAGAMLWMLNLYNFMDGIDGIAALQTVTVCCSAAWLSWSSGQGFAYPMFCLLLAAAHGGFLVWNFPPARLFMGDAGSVPTGLLLAGLIVVGAVQGQLNPLCWLILLAVFITDASWTLIWRIVNQQSFMQPHRLHAYQRLSRHWYSHFKVDLLLLLINVTWLLPLAMAALVWPSYAIFMVILAYLPVLYAMAKVNRLT